MDAVEEKILAIEFLLSTFNAAGKTRSETRGSGHSQPDS
jgi:hypothetical protein